MTTIPAPTRGLTPTERLVPPETPTIQNLCDRAGAVVNTTSALAGEVAELHTSAVSTSAEAEALRIDQRAQAVSGRPMMELLQQLADTGLAWRDVAALAGVSVPAVRKWRQGGTASGPNRLRVAKLVVLIDWLEAEKLISDVASWLEVPLMVGVPVSRLDLLVGQRSDLVIASVTGEETAAGDLLDRFDARWRDHSSSDFEVFDADDGLRSIRRREHR